MRLWTVHPEYLDARGLVALWREGLLAKSVLEGKTRGYRSHPQLTRFRSQPDPQGFLCAYLREVLAEADRRGYRFDGGKLPPERRDIQPVDESRGQLEYEWQHLMAKLSLRDRERYRRQSGIKLPRSHPLFHIVPGAVQEWEKIPAGI